MPQWCLCPNFYGRSPMIDKFSHIQSLPNALMTSQKDAGDAFVWRHGKYVVILFTARATSFIGKISPCLLRGHLSMRASTLLRNFSPTRAHKHPSSHPCDGYTFLPLCYVATPISYGFWWGNNQSNFAPIHEGLLSKALAARVISVSVEFLLGETQEFTRILLGVGKWGIFNQDIVLLCSECWKHIEPAGNTRGNWVCSAFRG